MPTDEDVHDRRPESLWLVWASTLVDGTPDIRLREAPARASPDQLRTHMWGGPERPLRSGISRLWLTNIEDDGLITGTWLGRILVRTITDRGREDITASGATSRRVGSEMQRAEPKGKGAQLSTAQHVVTEFAQDVNEEIAMCANRGDRSPEAVRRFESELNQAHEAIARRLSRP